MRGLPMPEHPPVRPLARVRWRQGAGRGRTTTIYAQRGTRPTDDDELVCIADSPELAVHIVAAHNSILHIEGPARDPR